MYTVSGKKEANKFLDNFKVLYRSYLMSYFNRDLVSYVLIYRKRCDMENGRLFFLGHNFVRSPLYTKNSKPIKLKI